MIRLQLNPKESPDREIEQTLTAVSNVAALETYDLLQKHLERLVTLTQELLKKEWEKVKKECREGKLIVGEIGSDVAQPRR